MTAEPTGREGIIDVSLSTGRKASVFVHQLMLMWQPEYKTDLPLSMLTEAEYAEVLAATESILPRPLPARNDNRET